MFIITWCNRSNGELALGLLTDAKMVLISKSFSKGVKSHLNSDPLSNTTLRGRGYLHSHVLLKTWITLADDLSTHSSLSSATSSRSNVGIPMISSQPVAGSIIFV